MTTPCVIYCAKSTEDKHESIPGQLADCRTRATDEGWTVVGEYSDEGFSAYSASRGPGLIAAREHAAAAAAEHGTVAMLLCQHSDGISRGAGDKPGATDALVEIWHQERRRNVWLRSVDADDDDLRTTKGAARIGDRNHKDGKRKSAATRAGLQRRKERGEPVGRAYPVGLPRRGEHRGRQGRDPAGDRPRGRRGDPADVRPGRGGLHVRRRIQALQRCRSCP